MRTDPISTAARIVAEAVIAAASRAGSEGGTYPGAEYTLRDLNTSRWQGTALEGTNFDALQQATIANQARFLAETEAGWNILDAARRGEIRQGVA